MIRLRNINNSETEKPAVFKNFLEQRSKVQLTDVTASINVKI